jgi:type II secretory ATPase GspE/PulE/Tfp pilus assembly ATPase PilB-like protein
MSVEVPANQNIRTVIDKIRAASDIDAILLDVSQDICTVLGADRVTIYVVNEDKTLITSKVKIGLDSYEVLRLPMAPEYSVAGYVAINKRAVNIRDVYDDKELCSLTPRVYFLKEIDKFSGYKTTQMLAAPIIDAGTNELIGVIQIINTRSGKPFPKSAEEGIERLCKALAGSFLENDRTEHGVRTKYDYLVVDGVISAADFERAVRQARRRRMDMEQVLLSEFQVSAPAIGAALSKFFNIPHEPFRPDRIKPAGVLRRLKRKFVQGQGWLPVEEDGSDLVVITVDPERIKRSRIVSQIFPDRNIQLRVCTAIELESTIRQFYGAEGDSAGSVDTIISRMEDDSSLTPSSTEERVEPDSATVQLVNRIIASAHEMRASDIHIEPRPGTGKTRIRLRIDGALMNYNEIPASHHAKLVARLKIMAELDISNRREPQDGKIRLKQFYPALDLELRVATIPTAGGKEDVVMRISSGGKPVALDQLGLSAHNLETLKPIVTKPHGLFLVCGPTGSGKTTTLHSVLDFINTPETKIWTAEDPVEITQEGLRQVQINPKGDLTFARVMRAFLRADPNVIMVGEMRDKETTAMGIEASLTGHCVFATLHTNSAPESIVRLLDMGMDPFNFSDALLGILAQRLAKRLCAKCKKPHVATPEEIKRLLEAYCEDLKHTERYRDEKVAHAAVHVEWKKHFAYGDGQFLLYDPAGCEECHGSGYKGRVGLHELMRITPALRKNIQERARLADIVVTALDEGMRTLKMDGVEKVLQGVTDMKQVRSVCI